MQLLRLLKWIRSWFEKEREITTQMERETKQLSRRQYKEQSLIQPTRAKEKDNFRFILIHSSHFL